MNIINYIIRQFINNNKFNTISIIVLSLLINFLKINVISYIVANIIGSINKKNEIVTKQYYVYFIIVSLFYIIIYGIYKIIQNNLLSVLKQDIKTNLVEILLNKNNENMSNINFSKLNTPILRISASIFYIFNEILTLIIPNITLIIIISIYFFYKSTTLGTIFIIGNLIILIYIILSYQNISYKNKIYEESLHKNDSYIVEILNNIDKIIFRGYNNNEIDNLKNYSNETINDSLKFYSSAIFHSIFLNLIIFLTIFISIYYLIKIFYKNEITTTVFITFITMLLLYRDIILVTIQRVPDIIGFVGRSIQVINIYKTANVTEVSNKEYDLINLKYDEIRFDNVIFSYNNDGNINEESINEDRINEDIYKEQKHFNNKLNNNKILDCFNIIINTEKHNKIIGLTGISGSGKSTAMKLLIKAYDYYEGDIYIDNINIRNVDPLQIRKDIIYVNQNSKLFDKTVIDNIIYGCKDNKCEYHIKEIMKLPKLKALFENIYINKKCGLGGENLSGGQRQVINIINGLIIPSKIVILDEPTNALDKDLKKDVIEMIGYFKNHKKCIIVITHDKDVYEIFDEKIEI